MTTPPITLGAVNMEAEDPQSLASFYAHVTGGTPQLSGDTVHMPPAGPGGLARFFQPVSEPRPARLTITST